MRRAAGLAGAAFVGGCIGYAIAALLERFVNRPLTVWR